MKVKLLMPVKHGEYYKAGDVIEVSEKSAERLFRLKAAERINDNTPLSHLPVGAQTPQPADPPGNSDGEQQTEKPIDEMTKEELQAELTALGVPFHSNTKISDLKALLSKELKEAKAQ